MSTQVERSPQRQSCVSRDTQVSSATCRLVNGRLLWADRLDSRGSRKPIRPVGVEPMRARATVRRRNGGFSLVELLVTILLAGIIFLAMVPLFVSGLKTTSTNTRRIIATNIAQARIESMRMLNWNDITQANLNSNTFADGQFATTYTPPAGGNPYTITTSVSPSASPSPMPSYKVVTVTVTTR